MRKRRHAALHQVRDLGLELGPFDFDGTGEVRGGQDDELLRGQPDLRPLDVALELVPFERCPGGRRSELPEDELPEPFVDFQAAQLRDAAAGAFLEKPVLLVVLEDRHVHGSAAPVEHHDVFGGSRVVDVGDGGGRRFVEQGLHLHSAEARGGPRTVAGRAGRVRGDGHDGPLNVDVLVEASAAQRVEEAGDDGGRRETSSGEADLVIAAQQPLDGLDVLLGPKLALPAEQKLRARRAVADDGGEQQVETPVVPVVQVARVDRHGDGFLPVEFRQDGVRRAEVDSEAHRVLPSTCCECALPAEAATGAVRMRPARMRRPSVLST